MAYRKTDEEYVIAATQADCLKNMLDILGLRTFNYKSVRHRLKRLNIDTSHWVINKGSFKKGHTLNKISILERLVQYAPNLKSSDIKDDLVKNKLMEYKCKKCGLNEWLTKPIILHLDHINGVNTDYRLENLRLLCPNCHSQTDTYCGRNLKYERKRKFCKCGKEINLKANFCVNHYKKPKIEWPEYNLLFEEVLKTSYLAVGKRLGVSDNSVRKCLKKNGKLPIKKKMAVQAGLEPASLAALD